MIGNALSNPHWFPDARSALLRCELARGGARGFGSALLRCKLTWGGARGFRIGIGCLGMILMTWEWCRQVGIGRMGVGTVTVVTLSILLITLLVHKDDISHEHLKELLYEEIMPFLPAPTTWGSSGFRWASFWISHHTLCITWNCLCIKSQSTVMVCVCMCNVGASSCLPFS